MGSLYSTARLAMNTLKNTLDFCREYAGWIVEIEGNPRADYGRVVGYYKSIFNPDLLNEHYIIVELLDKIEYGFTYDHQKCQAVVEPRTIRNRCLGIVMRRLKPLTPPITPISLPDNCDDCGAVGEESCALTCPNR